MRPRILQLTGMHSTKFGGMERYLLALAEAARQRGHDTVIQYQETPASRTYLELLEAGGVDLTVRPIRKPLLGAASSLREILHTSRPQIINTHFVPIWLLPLVTTMGTIYGTSRHIAMVHNVRGLRRSWKVRAYFSGFDYVLGVSDAVAVDLVTGGVGGDRVHTHYMGLIDPLPFDNGRRERIRAELGLPAHATLFGNIAFDAPFKGVDVLLQAFAALSRHEPDLHLMQLGIDPTRSELPRQYSDVKQLHWMGIRDNAASYLPAVDCYVQPSRFGEGLPLAILEAMAAARPVIATAVAGNREAVIDGLTGYLVPPESATALTGAMARVARIYRSSPEQLHAMGTEGHKRYAERFDGRESTVRLVERYYL